MFRPLQGEGRTMPGSVYFYVVSAVRVEIKRPVTLYPEKELGFTERYGLQQNFLPDINFADMVFIMIIIFS